MCKTTIQFRTNKMLLYREGYLEDKQEQKEKEAYTKRSKEVRRREAFVRQYTKLTKKKSKSQEKPINMLLIPHELRVEFALSKLMNFTTANNRIVNGEVDSSDLNEQHFNGRVLDSKLINSLRSMKWRGKKNIEMRYKKLTDIINNRKERVIYESKIVQEKYDLISKDDLNQLNMPKESFLYEIKERIVNLVNVWKRLNNQTRNLQAAKKRTEKTIQKNGLSTEMQAEKLNTIDRNWLILNELNNKLHTKECNLEYQFNPLLSNLYDNQTALANLNRDKNLSRKQKRNKKYREYLKKVGVTRKKKQKYNIKGIMRSIEHNVSYRHHEVDFQRLNEEYKKLKP